MQIKENTIAPRHWPLCGNSPATGEFPAQMASNAENVSIWWRHHMYWIKDGYTIPVFFRLEMKNYNISMLPSWARCGSLGHGGRERNEQRYRSDIALQWHHMNIMSSEITDIFGYFLKFDLATWKRIRISSPLRWESSGHQWIPLTKRQKCGNCSWRHHVIIISYQQYFVITVYGNNDSTMCNS